MFYLFLRLDGLAIEGIYLMSIFCLFGTNDNKQTENLDIQVIFYKRRGNEQKKVFPFLLQVEAMDFLGANSSIG